MTFSQTQVRSYVDDGFVIVPGLLGADEVEELKADTIRLARGTYPCPGIAPASEDSSDDDVLKNILAIHFPHAVSAVMLRYLKHPAIAAVLGQITGAHLPHWDGRVKGFQSMVFVKPPSFQGQAWHQDEVFIPTRDRSLVRCLGRDRRRDGRERLPLGIARVAPDGLPLSPETSQSSG